MSEGLVTSTGHPFERSVYKYGLLIDSRWVVLVFNEKKRLSPESEKVIINHTGGEIVRIHGTQRFVPVKLLAAHPPASEFNLVDFQNTGKLMNKWIEDYPEPKLECDFTPNIIVKDVANITTILVSKNGTLITDMPPNLPHDKQVSFVKFIGGIFEVWSYNVETIISNRVSVVRSTV